MVRVVLCVPDEHILKQYAICSKNVVRPGPDLLSVPLHPLSAPVLQPRIAPWEEVYTHIHQTICCEFFYNVFRLQCSFQILQVGIKISGHQGLGPVRTIPDGR